MALRGYKRIPGSARRYRTPSGRVISRRQYDNRRAKAQGFESKAELERRFKAEPALARWRRKIREHNRSGWPSPLDDGSVLHNIEEVRRRRAALPPGAPDSADPELVAPDGPLADLLARTGARPPDTYQGPVSDPPARGSR